MVRRVLHPLAQFAEIPLVVLAIIAASLWLGSWLAIPVGFVVGRVLYYPIKLGIAISIIGPGWNKAWAEMIRLDVTKVSLGGNAMSNLIIFFPLGISMEVIGSVTDLELLLWLGFSLAVFVGINYGFATMPAAILFLGRSSAETNTFLWNLRLRVFPLRVTSLLDAQSSNEKLGTVRRRLRDLDNVRVGDSDDWLEVVTRLATITPILILDGRWTSDAVATEIKLLNQPGFAEKTVVIAQGDGQAPAINAALDRGVLAEPPSWQRLNALAALTELPRMCRAPESFASPQTSVSS